MRAFVIFILAGLVAFAASPAFCQQVASSGADNRMFSDSGLPDAPEPQEPVGTKAKNPKTTEDKANREVPRSKQQPKRILRVMPNYPAVSAGAIPPPPTPREAFTIATQESLDYSAFVFVGLTSMLAEGQDAHPELGKGIPASGVITGADSSTGPTAITG